MKRHKGIIVLVLIALLVLLAKTSAYMVDQTKDIVVLTRFGKVQKVIDGRKESGLQFKWPYPVQKATIYDYRNRVLRSPAKECQTREKHPFVVTASCIWRIEDAKRFYSSQKDIKSAEDVLRIQLSSRMSAVIGQHQTGDLVNTDRKLMKLQQIGEEIRSGVAASPDESDKQKSFAQSAMDNYGIAILSVGIETLGLPQEPSKAVVSAMITERGEEINRYEAEGKATADAIVGRAEAAKKIILTFAEREAAYIRTRGEAEAAKYYAELGKYPEFSMFLRSMESMKKILKGRTVFLLDSTTFPALQWLQQRPTLDSFGPQKPAITGARLRK